MLEEGNILITGGAGAFGSAFARYLLSMERPPKRIVIYSRGEYRQFQVSQELKPLDKQESLRFMIGDVRDRWRLRRALEGIDVVVHAAALKRIEVGQYNPMEVKKTNVDGAENVIEAAQDAGVKKVIALSTDKACEPVSPYGLSKALAECLFINANNTRGWDGPIYSVCRYGNVWGSTGSVVPLWKKMIAEGAETVPITDPDCTRFFMRMEEAVTLVAGAIEDVQAVNCFPVLPAYRLGDLAEAMGVKTHTIGLPHYEKQHESMARGFDSEQARRMSVEELREVLANG